MEEAVKTTKKRPRKLFTGVEGKTFAADNQPTPEQKSDGWKKKRAERLLTQGIIEYMTQGKKLPDYIDSLYKNASKGNPKAIETINKGLEDDIIKIASTDSEGHDTIDYSKLSDDVLNAIINARNPGNKS